MSSSKSSFINFPPPVRYLLGGACILLVLGLLAWAASIPFFYQSTSIWYKIGIDRALLRTGKVIGLLAATLLFLQITLISHLKIIDSIFTPRLLVRIHKINAGVVAALALLHPLFIFAPEDISNIPIEWKYWPEGAGAFLLLLIWLIFITSTWRSFLGFSFKSWRLFHRFAALSAGILLSVHILNVSDTFITGPPRIYVISALSLFIVFWIRIQARQRIS